MSDVKTDIDILRKGFAKMILSNRIIVKLFFVATEFDTVAYSPTQYGNLDAWINIMSDDWLDEVYHNFTDEQINSSIHKKQDILRTKIVEYLKDVIE